MGHHATGRQWLRRTSAWPQRWEDSPSVGHYGGPRFPIGKSLLFLSQLSQKSNFPSSTLKPGKPPPSTFQTVHFTSLERFRRRFCYSKNGFATVRRFCLFLFHLFRQNHWKIIVNHRKIIKIKNLILLDSTWVDLHSEYIILYALVQSFYYDFLKIELK
jgi:hypothetical protein